VEDSDIQDIMKEDVIDEFLEVGPLKFWKSCVSEAA